MLDLLLSNPPAFLIASLALILSISIHEFAHAWMAVRLGDPTPKLQGRLTLNPMAHLDPLGTLLLILVGFGWGRPVQFDHFNLLNPRKDTALISLAGPASNILVASIFSIIMRLLIASDISISADNYLYLFYVITIRFSVLLAVFNLIPVHPLDGGKILVGLLPPAEAARADLFMKKYGIFILILLIFPIFGSSPVFAILSPIISFLVNIYIPSAGLI